MISHTRLYRVESRISAVLWLPSPRRTGGRCRPAPGGQDPAAPSAPRRTSAARTPSRKPAGPDHRHKSRRTLRTHRPPGPADFASSPCHCSLKSRNRIQGNRIRQCKMWFVARLHYLQALDDSGRTPIPCVSVTPTPPSHQRGSGQAHGRAQNVQPRRSRSRNLCQVRHNSNPLPSWSVQHVSKFMDNTTSVIEQAHIHSRDWPSTRP